MFDEEVKVNSHGVNAKIKSHILSDEEMRAIGFTDYCKDMWYFSRMIQFPSGKYKGIEISFNVSIPKDGSDIRIDVLDEDFCQPYDYQMILNKNPTFPTALIVLNEVEQCMNYLQSKGVLSGHVKGEYI